MWSMQRHASSAQHDVGLRELLEHAERECRRAHAPAGERQPDQKLVGRGRHVAQQGAAKAGMNVGHRLIDRQIGDVSARSQAQRGCGRQQDTTTKPHRKPLPHPDASILSGPGLGRVDDCRRTLAPAVDHPAAERQVVAGRGLRLLLHPISFGDTPPGPPASKPSFNRLTAPRDAGERPMSCRD